MRNTAVSAAILALALAFAPARLRADSLPFSLSALTDGAIGAAGLGLYGSSLYFDSIKGAPDASAVDAAKIPFFDKLYTTSHSAWMGTAADGLTIAAALVPAALIPGREGRDLLTLGVMYAETLGLAYALDSGIKSVVTRYRPYAYSASASDFADPDIAASFASRHATIAFASAVFAGYVFDKSNPDSPWRPAVWASGLALATVTSVARVASGDHFPSDVVAGAAFGALVGYLVPLFHQGAAGTAALAAVPASKGLTLSLNLGL